MKNKHKKDLKGAKRPYASSFEVFFSGAIRKIAFVKR